MINDNCLQDDFLNFWLKNPPIYDIAKSYEENLLQGPIIDEKFLSERVFPSEDLWIDFLGHKIASPIGIPAGPLLDADWVIAAARLGFDVLTYKTIRSRFTPAHKLPNMLFIDKTSLTAFPKGEKPKNILDLAVTNSFGVPSQDPEFIKKDIEKALKGISKGQLLIVSVMGTPPSNSKECSLEEDFAQTALLAVEAGAPIIELNFSCPNLSCSLGEAYTNTKLITKVISSVKSCIKDIPIIVKLGKFDDDDILKRVVCAVAEVGGEGICGLNTLKIEVRDQKGNPALGKERLKAGICGVPLRQEALEFGKKVALIKQQENLDLKLLLTGGAVLPEHLYDFLNASADIAMTAAGMMWNPLLALQFHRINHV